VLRETDREIGKVVRALRKQLGWDQRELARRLGFANLQTVSDIERAKRSLKASEVVRLADLFHVSANDLLSGRAPSPGQYVLWREADESADRKENEALFLQRCQRYAFLEKLTGNTADLDLPQYSLDPATAGFEKVEALADEVRNTLLLGEIVGPGFREALANQWKVKIFEAFLANGSGATTRGEFGAAILENITESPKRRVFSLGHELFHLLTWDSATLRTPERSCNLDEYGEKLANAFAAALLMPRAVVQRKIDSPRIKQIADLIPVAQALSVSLPALLWRLVTMGRLVGEKVQRFLDQWWGSTDPGWSPPAELDRPLPERFVSLAFTAYMSGDISIGKLAELLETTVGMVEHFLLKYGLDLNLDEYQAEVLPA